MAALSPRERSELARRAVQARWLAYRKRKKNEQKKNEQKKADR